MAVKAGLEKRVVALDVRKVYRISSLADLVVLAAMRPRGDQRRPRAEDVEWDPEFDDLMTGKWLERANQSKRDRDEEQH